MAQQDPAIAVEQKPYHEAIVDEIALLGRQSGDFVRLNVLGRFAAKVKVPPQHRAAIAAAFVRKYSELDVKKLFGCCF